MSARSELEQFLKPFCKAKGWVLVPVAKAIGNIDKVHVVLKLSSVARATNSQGHAVHGTYKTGWDVFLINPTTDLAKAQVLLDDDVIELFDLLDSRAEIDMQEATSTPLNDTWAGFTLSIETTTITSQE